VHQGGDSGTDEDAAIFPFEDSSTTVFLAKPFDERSLLMAIARMTREVGDTHGSEFSAMVL
jgi:hypothetical protein